MSETVTLTIDGRTITVPKGTNVLEAAKQLDIEIPHFCYHPGLSAPAVCRQCLVSVEKAPKLAPSCYTPCGEGMVVSTQSTEVKQAQQQMLEFTLLNHPVDCPICDKAGECTLQRQYFDYDAQLSRSSVAKVHKAKRVDLGPHIVLDQERCILCTRCVRVCTEIAHEPQLTMAFRGDHEILTTAPGQQLDNPYALNTVDVCPVGALTSKDFRFTLRAWELHMTPSVCSDCATGCNVEVHHREGQIYRLVPRENADVNRYWMCDEGRLSYHRVRQRRVASALVDNEVADVDAALTTAAERLARVLDAERDSVGVVLCAEFGNEDNYALARLAREFLALSRLYVTGRAPEPDFADEILRDADRNPNTAGVRALAGDVGDARALAADLTSGKLSALLALGDLGALAPEALTAARELDALVLVLTHESELGQATSVVLPAADWAEADSTVTNKAMRVQRRHAAVAPPGQSLPAWQLVVRLGRKLGATIDYDEARAVFADLRANVAALSGAEFGVDQPPILLRFAHSRG